jgi:hypothetical protein
VAGLGWVGAGSSLCFSGRRGFFGLLVSMRLRSGLGARERRGRDDEGQRRDKSWICFLVKLLSLTRFVYLCQFFLYFVLVD